MRVAGLSLRFIERTLLQLQRRAIRSPRLTLSIAGVLLLVALAASARLRVQTSIDDMVNSDFTTTRALRDLKDDFGDKNELFVALTRRDGARFTRGELCAVKNWLRQERLVNRGLARVFSPFSLEKARWGTTEDDAAGWQSLLEARCDEAGAPVDEVVSFAALRASPWGGVIVPARSDVDDLAVDFYLRDRASDPSTSRFGSFDPSAVRAIVELEKATLERERPELEAHWTGMAAFQYYVNEGFQNFFVLNVIVLAVLFLFLRVALGTFRAPLVLVSTLLASGVLLYGVMGALGLPLELLSNNLFLLLVVSTIEDFLFVSFLQSQKGAGVATDGIATDGIATDGIATDGGPAGRWRRPYRQLIAPGFFTSVSTAVGFGSLAISDLEIVRRFGGLAALGALIEWAMVFLVLPAAAQCWPRLRVWVRHESRRRSTSAASLAARLARLRPPRGLARAALVLYPAALVAAWTLTVADSPEKTFPPHHPFSETFEYMRATRATRAIASVVFDDVRKTEHNRLVLLTVRGLADVAAVEDPYRIEDYVLADLPDAARRLFASDVRGSYRFRRYVSPGGRARAIVYLKDSEVGAVNRVRASVASLCPAGECWLAGTPVSYAEFAGRLRATLLSSLVVSLGLVAAVLVYLGYALGFGRKSRRGLFALLLASFWGPAVALVAMAALRVPINLASCVFAATLVGLAGDNAVQFLFGATRGSSLLSGVDRLGGAPLLVTAAMSALALCFLASAFEPPRELGLLLTFGFLATLAGDLFLLRGLLPPSRDRA